MNFVTKDQFVEFARFYVNQFQGEPNFAELYDKMMAFYGIQEESPRESIMKVLAQEEVEEEQNDIQRIADHKVLSETLLAVYAEDISVEELIERWINRLRRYEFFFLIPDMHLILQKELYEFPKMETLRHYVKKYAIEHGKMPKEPTKIYE